MKQPLHLRSCVRSHLEVLVDTRVNELLAQRSLELLLVPCFEGVLNPLINERLAAAGFEPSDLVDSCHTIHLPYDQMGRVDGVDGVPSPLPILSASYGDGHCLMKSMPNHPSECATVGHRSLSATIPLLCSTTLCSTTLFIFMGFLL